MNTQRGGGVFDRSIRALQMLNAAGYGVEGSGLTLDLVYNPGATLLCAPSCQCCLRMAVCGSTRSSRRPLPSCSAGPAGGAFLAPPQSTLEPAYRQVSLLAYRLPALLEPVGRWCSQKVALRPLLCPDQQPLLVLPGTAGAGRGVRHHFQLAALPQQHADQAVGGSPGQGVSVCVAGVLGHEWASEA